MHEEHVNTGVDCLIGGVENGIHGQENGIDRSVALTGDQPNGIPTLGTGRGPESFRGGGNIGNGRRHDSSLWAA